MIFLSKQLMENHYNHFIDGGSEGNVFHVEDERVAKLFHHSRRLNRYNQQDLLKFQDLQIKNFTFVDELIYYSFRIGGVLMPLTPGKQLTSWYLSNVPIEDLIRALNELVLAIEELSDYGVRVDYDIAARNTLYDGLSFYFIDTMGYERGLFDYEESYTYNRKEILFMIYYEILDLDSIYGYFQKMHGFDSLYTSDLLMVDPKEVLEELKASLEQYLGESINTFGEAALLMRK